MPQADPAVAIVIQLARVAGFAPIITTASLHNVNYLKSLGATHVLERTVGQGHLQAEIMRIAGGPLALVYDAISRDESFALSYGVTAPTGQLIIVSPGVFPSENPKTVHLANGLFSSSVNRDVGASLRIHLKGLLEAGDVKVSLYAGMSVVGWLNDILSSPCALKFCPEG